MKGEIFMVELKKRYNNTLIRIEVGTIYFKDPSVPLEEKERTKPAFIKLIKLSRSLLISIGEYTKEEELRGFVLEGYAREDFAKKRYNKILEKQISFQEYLDNQDVPASTREKHIPIFIEVCDKLSKLLREIKNYNHIQAVNGFEVI